MKNIKTVIFAGGSGTRLREETEFRPKPMVEVGGIPILVHIMKIYSHYGFNDFIVALGYKGDMIRQYFLNYLAMNNDFQIDLAKNEVNYLSCNNVNFRVILAETGPHLNRFSGLLISVSSKN